MKKGLLRLWERVWLPSAGVPRTPNSLFQILDRLRVSQTVVFQCERAIGPLHNVKCPVIAYKRHVMQGIVVNEE